jgi:hypothetical protein
MKIFVIHDDAGRIRGTLAASPGIVNVGVKPLGGLRAYATEVVDAVGLERQRFIHDLHTNHRVSMASETPALVRTKEQSKASTARRK